MRALRSSVGRVLAVAWLIGWASGSIVKSSIMVARDIVAPSARVVPGVLILPLRCRSATEVAALSGLITLTPGTLTVGVAEDLSELWVHGMYGSDRESLRADLVAVEDRVLRALRYPEGGAA